MYYHGGQSLFAVLDAMSAATDTGKTTLIVNGQLHASGNKWYYDTAQTNAGLIGITFGQAITTGNWTEMKDASNNPINHVEITPTAGDVVARIVEVDSSAYPVAFADIPLYIG